jgi:transposase-like protein
MRPRRSQYYVNARISEHVFRRVLRAFGINFTASDAARLTGLSVRSANAIYLKLRRSIAAECEAASPFAGEVEVDESYFGPRRVRGKCGRGAGGKTIVFGVFKRNGCVYTEIVPACKRATLLRAIRGRVGLDSVVHSNGWRGYDGLVDVGYAWMRLMSDQPRRLCDPAHRATRGFRNRGAGVPSAPRVTWAPIPHHNLPGRRQTKMKKEPNAVSNPWLGRT